MPGMTARLQSTARAASSHASPPPGADFASGGGEAAALVGSLTRWTLDNAGRLTGDQYDAINRAVRILAATTWRRQEAGEPAILLQIKAHVEAQLGEPDLSPSSIARALGLSARHVHRLFRMTGSSLGRWILERRLACCAVDLADPSMVRSSLTQIAFRWGFNDSAHFSRAFKAAYDQTPREYRAARLALALTARASFNANQPGWRSCL